MLADLDWFRTSSRSHGSSIQWVIPVLTSLGRGQSSNDLEIQIQDLPEKEKEKRREKEKEGEGGREGGREIKGNKNSKW